MPSDISAIPLLVGMFLLAIFITYFGLVSRTAQYAKWVQEFQDAGYSVSKNLLQSVENYQETPPTRRILFSFPRTWQISKDGMTFLIKMITRGDTNRQNCYFSATFSLPPEIRDHLYIRIKKRGIISKVLRIYRGQYHHINGDFAVYSTNFQIVKHLLNTPRNLAILTDTLKKCPEIDTRKKNRITTPQRPAALIKTCDNVIRFVNILKSLIGEVMHTSPDGGYTVEEILTDIDLDSIELYCVICYQHVKPEDMSVMGCCSSVAHAEHIRTWLSSHNECPYCRSKSIMLLDPVA